LAFVAGEGYFWLAYDAEDTWVGAAERPPGSPVLPDVEHGKRRQLWPEACVMGIWRAEEACMVPDKVQRIELNAAVPNTPRAVQGRKGVWSHRLFYIAVGLLAGVLTGGVWGFHLDAVPPEAASDFRLMAEAWNTIQRVYVDPAAVHPTRLAWGAISGMVDSLDDVGHSRFLTPDMRRIERAVTKGTVEGIGAEIRAKGDQIIIVAPLDNSPAQHAGLRPGDVILKVNGMAVRGLPLDEVVGRIVGQANTPVTLSVLTPSIGSPRTLHLVRRRIALHSVTWHRLPGTALAHIRVAGFSKGVTVDLRAALLAIRSAGLTGAILDLRSDPGGLLEEAVGVASQFLTDGNVVLVKDTAGKVLDVPVRPGGVAPTLPLAVLIDQGTASASEIVAAALHDAHRAWLVGETTFGTGTILKSFPLSDGSALLLAVAEWLTPAGHLLWHKGVQPDIAVPLPPDGVPLRPAAEQGMTARQLRLSRDAPLLRAVTVLTRTGQGDPSSTAQHSAHPNLAAGITRRKIG
jgi:carboxyl-terminal processing protease